MGASDLEGTGFLVARIRRYARTVLLVVAACSESIDGSAKPRTWSLVSVPTTQGFTIVRGSGPADVWVAGGDSVWRWDGQNWSSPSGFRMGPGAAFWVNSPTDAWAGVGQKVAYHWTGTGWVSALLNDNRVARALWGSGPSDVWASDCGAGYLGHYDGTGWTHLQSIDNGSAIWGAHSGDVWIIDAYCTPSSSGPSSIIHGNGISGNATSGYYLAGRDTQFTSPHNLQAIWGSGPSDIWAVGDSGAIVHYDGRAWTQLAQSPATVTLHGVWGTAADDIWAVGDGGVILHFDALGWSRTVSPTTRTLHAVWGNPSGDVWAVGDSVTVLHLTR